MNGEKFEGEFKNDNMHGKGVLTEASGNQYLGHWKEGKRDGKGTMNFNVGRGDAPIVFFVGKQK